MNNGHRPAGGIQRLRDWKHRRVTPPTVGNTARSYPQYSIGPHTYGHIRVFHDAIDHTLEIGDYCSLGEGTTFWVGGGHRPDWVTTYPFNTLHTEFAGITGHPASRGDVSVGSDVWTGFESLIMSGVAIGHGAIVGTRSVVTRDVEPYSIVAGSPAREIRKRFDDATIERLLDIAWWDWSEREVRDAVPLLQSADIQTFCAAAEAGDIGPRTSR